MLVGSQATGKLWVASTLCSDSVEVEQPRMASQATARDGDRRPKIIDLSDRTWQSKEFKPETPVIVRGGASDGPAFSKLDFDFFAKKAHYEN